jgi:hypothetical protein
MLDRLAGIDPFCEPHATGNLEHWQAGRAEVCNFWLLCAAGSGEPIGYLFGATTLYERPRGYFSTQGCASYERRGGGLTAATPWLSFHGVEHIRPERSWRTKHQVPQRLRDRLA